MRRLFLVSAVISLASVSALLVSLFAFSEDSVASSAPSQGTYTQGATAGPDEPSLVDDTRPSDSELSGLEASSGGRRTGGDVVRKARRHIGTPYRNSPPKPCRAYKSEDCSCHTKLIFKSVGKWLPDNPVKQYRKGRKVAKSNLRKGDLVFFKEAGRGRPITHVAIYSGKDPRGNRKIIHASNYFGKVVESRMKYMRGYYGAKRVKLN